jgi:hypothetical protein
MITMTVIPQIKNGISQNIYLFCADFVCHHHLLKVTAFTCIYTVRDIDGSIIYTDATKKFCCGKMM